MALATYLVFLFLSSLLPLNSCESEKCQKSFQCGKFSMEFPFTDYRDPSGCGLIKVDGCGSNERPRILANEGYGYYILEKISTYKFKIYDSEIQIPQENRKCYTFRNVSLPQSPSISFTFSPNLTLFTCNNNSNNNELLEEHFKKYEKQECEISKLYYNASSTEVPLVELSSLPQACSVIQLPVKSHRDSDELLELLTANFTLELSVFEACEQCFNGGGQCLHDNQNAFYCKQNGNRTFRNKILIGGVIVAALASTSIILIFFVRRR